MIIPEEFIVQKFYQHAGYPKYVKSTNTYMGGCPICREGSSWGRKSRLYFIPKDGVICCHNCGWYSKPVNWIMEVEKVPYDELVRQIDKCEYEYGIPKEEKTIPKQTEELPKDSINLFDKSQLKYYADNNIVSTAASMIIDRRLNTAVNRPRALYVSLNDPVHKNRLIIPFYTNKTKCDFYQSRTLLPIDNDRPKYLSKMNSEKTLFNYDQIKNNADHIFITEGPIDSFFIRNSVAVAGIQERSRQTFTSTQKTQLDRHFLMQTVWVLDSQWLDQASRMKTETLLKSDECVFIWPKDVGTRFKDVNDMCMFFKIDRLSRQYILDNTYCGLRGLVTLNQIK